MYYIMYYVTRYCDARGAFRTTRENREEFPVAICADCDSISARANLHVVHKRD